MSKQKSPLLPGDPWGHPAASPRLPGMATDSLRESYTCLGAIADESLVWSQAACDCPKTGVNPGFACGCLRQVCDKSWSVVDDSRLNLGSVWD